MCVVLFIVKDKTRRMHMQSSPLHYIYQDAASNTQKKSSLTDSQRKFCPEMQHFMHVDMRDGACIPRTQSSRLTSFPPPNTSLS